MSFEPLDLSLTRLTSDFSGGASGSWKEPQLRLEAEGKGVDRDETLMGAAES